MLTPTLDRQTPAAPTTAEQIAGYLAEREARFTDGATVRLFGYAGVFTLRPYSRLGFRWGVERDGSGVLFGVSVSSVVELDGQPFPVGSLPIAPPAADYPHAPKASDGVLVAEVTASGALAGDDAAALRASFLGV